MRPRPNGRGRDLSQLEGVYSRWSFNEAATERSLKVEKRKGIQKAEQLLQ